MSNRDSEQHCIANVPSVPVTGCVGNSPCLSLYSYRCHRGLLQKIDQVDCFNGVAALQHCRVIRLCEIIWELSKVELTGMRHWKSGHVCYFYV